MTSAMLDLPTIARSVRTFASCGRSASGTWRFDWHFALDDESFLGHFPGHPVLPGAFLLEMAQRATEFALHGESASHRRIRSVPRLRFLHPVLPGDTCSLQVQWTSSEHIDIAFTTPGNVVARGVLSTGLSDDLPESSQLSPASAPLQDGAMPLDVLPHGHPLVLVDRFACDDRDSDRAIAIKNVTINEACYRHTGHGTAATGLSYPLAMIVESFAQGAGLLLSRRGFLTAPSTRPSLTLFGEFRDIQLLSDAWPGDRLRHDVRITSYNRQFIRLTGLTGTEDRIVARFGSLMAFVVDAGHVPRAESAI